DPELERHARRGDDCFLSVDPDRPLVRPEQPREDSDQRRLAGPVLAEQAVHLAAPELQVYAIVRAHAWERLRYPDQLDDRHAALVWRVHDVRLSVLKTRTARGGPGVRRGR